MKLNHLLFMTPALLLLFCVTLHAQNNTNINKFRQLHSRLRTPNIYRTASGAPGHAYWQQRADYKMQIKLDDENQRIYGEGTITYHNNSPDALNYLWVQLDQNIRRKDADALTTRTNKISRKMSFRSVRTLHYEFDGGFKLEYVKDSSNRDLHTAVNKTMMRVDLPNVLKPGASYSFKLKWWYNINDRQKDGGRSGYEYFQEDDNYLYTIAQFFPRMAVYNEVEGWQHKQFLGGGEFTLPFGNYHVSVTVPADHVVAATGVLKNAANVLETKHLNLFKKARTAEKPVIIISENEAQEKEKLHSEQKKTWIFAATNVRDFAFASSRKFIWDAMGIKLGDRIVMAMSLYPKEGNPLWERFSTKVIAHTLRTYSKYTFDYPYPVAWSIHSAKIGMEYPMICFNRGRPEKDSTYSEYTKIRMLSTIIHEIGHNFFPMIVNSDERQWTWMDEGLNAFLQYLTEQEWERGYPSRRGDPKKIVDYMKGDRSGITPIMTNSESLYQFGNNAYAKPATALNILRETILGRELFDFAFKEYARRWMFKHPTPDDFFRTMEDASGVDLDWFWRGWFYTTDYVDIAIDAVNWYQVDTKDPEVEKPIQKQLAARVPENITHIRNKQTMPGTMVEKDESLEDFYSKYDPYEISILDKQEYDHYGSNLSEKDKAMLKPGYNYYEVHFSNKGGLVMPLILKFEYDDSTNKLITIPAEIWRYNDKNIIKVFATKQQIIQITLDPYFETADVDSSNNYWPTRPVPTRFQLYKKKQPKPENKMQRAARADALREKTNDTKPPKGSNSDSPH